MNYASPSSPGFAAECIADLKWERAHGDPKRLVVICDERPCGKMQELVDQDFLTLPPDWNINGGMARRRWQVDLLGEDELKLARARRVFGADGDSEAGRALLALFSKLSAAVESGTVISFLPGDDRRTVDALPEFSRALRPESSYRWLVSVPHPAAPSAIDERSTDLSKSYRRDHGCEFTYGGRSRSRLPASS